MDATRGGGGGGNLALRTRLATLDDLPAVSALHIASCLDVYRPHVTAEQHERTLPENLRTLWEAETLPGNDFIVVAEQVAEGKAALDEGGPAAADAAGDSTSSSSSSTSASGGARAEPDEWPWEVVGIATVRVRPKGDTSDPHADTSAGTCGYVDHFHVRPDRKRRGVGRVLIRAAAAEMLRRGVASAYLDVLESNGPAVAFYTAAAGGALAERVTGDLFGIDVPARVVRWAEPALSALAADALRPT